MTETEIVTLQMSISRDLDEWLRAESQRTGRTENSIMLSAFRQELRAYAPEWNDEGDDCDSDCGDDGRWDEGGEDG